MRHGNPSNLTVITPKDVQGTVRGQLQIKIPTQAGGPLPVPANFFHFSQLGGLVQLNVMFLDVTRLSQAMAPDNRKVPFSPEVAGRFVLSLEGLSLLQRQVNDLVKQLRSQEQVAMPADIEPTESV